MTTFLFLRHGETEWNKLKKFTGQTDISLTDYGREQAKLAQKELALHRIDAAYSSDLERAIETATIALELSKNVPLHIDKRLREVNQGDWEGMLASDIKSRYADLFSTRMKNPSTVSPPNGESVAELQERLTECLEEIQEKHPQKSTILIASHGLTIAVARVKFGGFPIDSVWDYIPNNAEIIKINTA